MSKRNERHEADRLARRLAYQQNLLAQKSAAAEPAEIETSETIQAAEPTISEARLIANRLNAQKSTGPTSQMGRVISSLNAVTHGLTGNTILLDSDDIDLYETQLNEAAEEFKPATLEERRLVQSMHDCAWRLDRILRLESTIYAKDRNELQGCFDAKPVNQRKGYMELEIEDRNAKMLKNLRIQEARLKRQRKQDLVTLQKMQKERAQLKAAEQRLAELSANAAATPQAPHGFVFATAPNASETPATVDTQTTETPLERAA